MGERRCSFCGKPESEVTKLIAGTTAHICSECVVLSTEILDEDPCALPVTEGQLLVRFQDGTIHSCEQESAWLPFAHGGEDLEWCVARGTLRNPTPSAVVAVRRRDPPRPIVGATVPKDSPATMAEALSVVQAHGGASRFIRASRSSGGRDESATENGTWPWSLVTKGFIRDQEVANFLSQQYLVPTIDLGAFEVAVEILKLVSPEMCTKHVVLPVSHAGTSLIVAMADPTNNAAIDELKRATGYNIEPVIASAKAIRSAIARYYRRTD